MKSIDEIKLCCQIEDEDDCWVWTGSVDRGLPKIQAPDHTAGGMKPQVGRRAVWHIINGRALPSGWRVYTDPAKCRNSLCLNPAHAKAGPIEQWAADRVAAGVLKGNVKLIAQIRRRGRARSVLTPEMHAEIVASPDTGVALAQRMGISEEIVSRVRRGEMRSFQPLGGMFSQLMNLQGARP